MPPIAPIPPVMPVKHLAETLLIEGPDALAFAQAQFSNNVSELAVGRWQFSAWLDAQGRVRALFHLARLSDQRLMLVLRGGHADALAEMLRRFVFRSKLTITPMPPSVFGTVEPIDMYDVMQTNDGVVLGCGSHGWSLGAQEDDEWHAKHICAGWPWLPEEALDALLPPALSLERLQAVSFDKGCYPGQEMTARLHYRGGHKRHMHCVVLSQHVPPGNVLREEQNDVALILDGALLDERHVALAVVSDAIIEDEKTRALSWNGSVVDVAFEKRWPE